MSPQNHLTTLPLELQTHIFSNLQPYDILQVRQACQALYLASSQRMVWVDALHRICIENTLFEPSFPVASMSVQDLQRASMGPHRWIAKTSWKERNSRGVLLHSVAQHLLYATSDLSIADLKSLDIHYLVPGGRYLFSLSWKWLVLWDLGSPYSSGKEPYSVAAMPVKFYDFTVHSTPDGMGLRVFLPHFTDDDPDDTVSFYIYEIYPESTSPQLTQIAYTRIPGSRFQTVYSPSYDHLIFAYGNILTIWNYKANMWARWCVEGQYIQILTTKSAVMLIRPYGVSVWEIPPLLPESSLSMSADPSVMSPIFELYYPENQSYYVRHQTPCDWYSGTSQPLYYDVVEEDPDPDADSPLKIHRFEVAINSKISGGTLNLLKAFEVPTAEDCYFSMNARICQDKNVSLCTDAFTGCLAIHATDIYDKEPPFLTPLCDHYISTEPTFCPATGRAVYREIDHITGSPFIFVLDF